MKVIDGDGVVAEVLFPDGITEMNAPPFGAGLGLKTWMVDPELQWVGAQAHNRWLAEFVAEAPDRRIGVAIIPLCYDIPKAVEEIRQAHKNGLKGILIPSVWGTYAAYNSPVYYPVWEVCQELDMVVHTHSGPSDEKDMTLPGAIGVYLMEFHWWAARPLWTMVMGGVFEFFPKLKFAMTEVGEFWIPGMLEMMDIRASVKHTSGKLGDFRTHLTMKPSEYFARNCRVGASALMDKQSVDARYDIGINNLMWGTDYPHPEGTWPKTPEKMQECFAGIPEAELDRILGLNAIEFYGLDYNKCKAIADRIGPAKSQFSTAA
jgi:predicted TIM-barrel fold metal-dependent hydrolase